MDSIRKIYEAYTKIVSTPLSFTDLRTIDKSFALGLLSNESAKKLTEIMEHDFAYAFKEPDSGENASKIEYMSCAHPDNQVLFSQHYIALLDKKAYKLIKTIIKNSSIDHTELTTSLYVHEFKAFKTDHNACTKNLRFILDVFKHPASSLFAELSADLLMHSSDEHLIKYLYLFHKDARYTEGIKKILHDSIIDSY